MGDWKGFERLAERIARDLRPDATVTWDDHLPGRLSKTSRQIDVSIRWSDADQQYLSIVQAKDWGDPADLVAVGEFASVVEDVGATQGVMACRSGFTRGARNYARSKGIELYNLHDAESRDWRLELTIPLLWVDLHPSAQFSFHSLYLVQGEQLPLDNRDLPILFTHPGGPQIDPVALFEQLWNERAISDSPGIQHSLEAPLMATPVEDTNGQPGWRSIGFRIMYEVARRAWLGQFTPNQCRGLIDYLDDNAFIASHLPIGEIPTERDDQWVEVDDPGEVAVNVRGAMVTTTGFEITAGSGVVEDATVTTPSGNVERLG